MRRVRERTDGPNFQLCHEQVSKKGANKGIHGYTIDLLIILTLDEEVWLFVGWTLKSYGRVGGPVENLH